MTSLENKWTNQELEETALNLINEAEKRCVRLRLLGGVAVRLLCKEIIAQHPQLDRICGDIDFAGLSKDVSVIEQVLENQGFKTHKEFNFVNASSRMLFSRQGLKVDIILDEFRMNHHWPIRKRLLPDLKTLPLEDMIMTKLQIVHQNKKDLTDLLAMALKAEQGQLDLAYLTELCTKKWGFTYTVLKNCQIVLSQYSRIIGREAELTTLRNLYVQIKGARKCFGWRLRSLIGNKVVWYEQTEEPWEIWKSD